MNYSAHNSENDQIYVIYSIHSPRKKIILELYNIFRLLLLTASHIATVTWLWRNSDQIMKVHFCLPQMNWSVYVHILVYSGNTNRLKYTGNITVIWRHHYVIQQFHWSINCHKELWYLYRVNKVAILNILSRQNVYCEKTFKILFGDVIMTSSNSCEIYYHQKIEHAPMINCAKFHWSSSH